MKERYKVKQNVVDGSWYVDDDGDVICYAAQDSAQQKAQYVADALNFYSSHFPKIKYEG